MDRITQSLLTSYVKLEELDHMNESRAFERFATYCVLSSRSADTLAVEEVVVGDDSTPGIDAATVFINGSVVTNMDDLNSIVELGGHLEADFHFIQAKTSPNFDGARLFDFAEAVNQFFVKSIVAPRLIPVKEVVDGVLSMGVRLRANPGCHLHYVTTGRWTGDTHLAGRIESARQRLIDLNIFNSVKFSPIGADDLQRLYRATQNRISVEFVFRDRTVLPEIDGVDEAYLGYLEAKEFLKIVTDENDEMRRGLFEDNVRDFQGQDNEVNAGIAASLAYHRDRFVVLNNGVTMVARHLRAVGNNFHVEDFQIVNGCQTSNILYENRRHLYDVFVPLRLVVTQQEEIANSITAATNSQSKVSKEDLYALLNFQRKLEEHFSTYAGREQLFYERRSKQYAANTAIVRNKVVGRPQLVKAFASVFLGEPSRASRYYSTIYRQLGDRVFADDHVLDAYYASAVAQYRLEAFFRAGLLDGAFRPARYHLLHAIRILSLGEGLPPLNSNQMQRLMDKWMPILWNDEEVSPLYVLALETVKAATGSSELSRDFVKQPSFTAAVTAQAKEARASAHGTWLITDAD